MINEIYNFSECTNYTINIDFMNDIYTLNYLNANISAISVGPLNESGILPYMAVAYSNNMIVNNATGNVSTNKIFANIKNVENIQIFYR